MPIYLNIKLMQRMFPKETNFNHRCKHLQSGSTHVRLRVVSCYDLNCLTNFMLKDVLLKGWKFLKNNLDYN